MNLGYQGLLIFRVGLRQKCTKIFKRISLHAQYKILLCPTQYVQSIPYNTVSTLHYIHYSMVLLTVALLLLVVYPVCTSIATIVYVCINDTNNTSTDSIHMRAVYTTSSTICTILYTASHVHGQLLYKATAIGIVSSLTASQYQSLQLCTATVHNRQETYPLTHILTIQVVPNNESLFLT